MRRLGRAPRPSDAATALRMRTQRQRDTSCEMTVRRELHGRGLRYRVDCRPVLGLRRRADVVFRAVKVAVFIDGCFWHGCPLHWKPPHRHSVWWAQKIATNIQRDGGTTASLEDAGWLVIRVWEHDAAVSAAARIARLVFERRASGAGAKVQMAIRSTSSSVISSLVRS